jgi:hypothetical protein
MNPPRQLGGHMRPPLLPLEDPRDFDVVQCILVSAGLFVPDTRQDRAA